MARPFIAVLMGGLVAMAPAWAAEQPQSNQIQSNQIQFNHEDLKRHSDAVTEIVRRQIVEQPTDPDKGRVAMIGDLLKRRPDIGGARTLEPVDRRSAIAGALAII
jgi:hypothetical protein